MTDGGYTKTEGWNLQLQGRVRELEADLATAERHLRTVAIWTPSQPTHADLLLAQCFLKELEAKRDRAKQIAADIEALLGEAADVEVKT